MAEPLKFALPASARYFTPFARLPVELRLQIWEDAIYDPGMNFLKIAYEPAPRARGQHHAGAAPPICKASLSPLYPHEKAEVSHYTRLNQVISRLFDACAESRRVVQQFLKHPNTIKLHDGRVLTARDSADVICLDYIHNDLFTSGCRILTDVDCPGLDRIRHLGIRYCHKWETASPFCGQCGRVHCTDSSKNFPLHIYQFLARHMPNLQTVYLIDFLILRRSRQDTVEETPGPNKPPPSALPVFTSHGRRFYEVKPRAQADWVVSSQVFDVLRWARDNYRRYAVKSTTTRFRHMHPERVKFKVLSCEWEVSPVAAQPKGRSVTPKKGCNKRSLAGEAAGGRAVKTSKSQRRQAVTPLAAVPESPSAFIFGRSDDFDFTFCMDFTTSRPRTPRRVGENELAGS